MGYENENDILAHYGTKRHSGRYPWGSGENPYQHDGDFLSRIAQYRKDNVTYEDEETGKVYTGDTAIAKIMGISTTEFRTLESLAKNERRRLQVETAKSMRQDGHTLQEIGDRLGGLNESTVRSLLNASSEKRMNEAMVAADILKKQIDSKGMIDVGAGVEQELGISKEKMNAALTILKTQGYEVYGGRMPQMTNPGKMTTIKVACPPGTEHKEIYNYANVHSATDYISKDGGATFRKAFEYPSSMSSKRLAIRYGDEGGLAKDGVIELRRGVKDLDMGDAHYAQVRILVDGTHYLKGMAIYSDNMPDGVDVIFNSNKKNTGNKLDHLKPIHTEDPNNPFGSLIKERGGQSYYDDPKGKYIDPETGNRQSLSLINKRAEEGDWETWAKNLPSQFLAKQPRPLAKQQLDLAYAEKKAEYDDICNLNNPTVKKILLKSFSDDCDAASAHLKAAALPRQQYQVILPLNTIKDTEVYATNYNDGEKVALVRFPHQGTYEIPILTVNNKQKEGVRVLGKNSKDAIGINSNVAGILSGADFDGDTVLVIPIKNNDIRSKPLLDGLKGFEPKVEYATTKQGDQYISSITGMPIKVMKATNLEMGKISNLLTDMTIKGATQEELVRATKHAQVVIDAEKHKLDWKQSEKDNGIRELKQIYQGRVDDDGKIRTSASTLLSRSNADVQVPKTQGTPKVNIKGKPYYDPNLPEGSLIYTPVAEKYSKYTVYKVNEKTGVRTTKEIPRTQSTKQMHTVTDARKLSSGTIMEEVYAQYANDMKALANQARLTMASTGNIKYNPASAITYKNEVASLNAQLALAVANKPRERRAQALTNTYVKMITQENPDLKSTPQGKAQLKKIKDQQLKLARQQTGAQRTTINITEKEWEAIQSGAIHESKLREILNNTDIDRIREFATPKDVKGLTNAQISRLKAMKMSGYTTNDIAKALNISTSSVFKYLNS